MSGHCGIVHFDGEPVDRGLLRAMTNAMAFRGPDAQDCRVDGAVGLGHALLQTVAGARTRQPLSLDGRTWITADARIDARDELVRALAARGRAVASDCPDAGLVLHAWHAWDEDCVRHLLGDFTFAIWDGPQRRLFCAVDHLGVKPLFHAAAGARFVFSNTLDAVRAHPAAGMELDDLAVADFLLFELNQDPRSTAFAGIRRLPAAGYLVASRDGVRTGTYWDLPQAEVRYRDAGDYVAHFRELLTSAVRDRLRTRSVGVSMSGGLDSTAIAATARSVLVGEARPFELRAHTVVYDRLVRDEERRYSGLAAAHLAMPIRYYPADDLRLYDGFGAMAARFPDPYHAPDVESASTRGAARDARVLLTGIDGDLLLHEPPQPYLRALWSRGDLGRLAAAAAWLAISERRAVARRLLAPRRAPSPGGPYYPQWLEPGFEARLGLYERWRAAQAGWMEGGGVRPSARQYLADTMRYRYFFDQYDPGVTRVPLEVRHPFLDVRLVSFCLSLPVVPWCVRKSILRRSLAGMLPEAVLRRPKTPLGQWPGARLLQLPESRWIDDFLPQAGLERYVVRARVPRAAGGADPMRAWMDLRPLTLSLWLRGNLSEVPTKRSMQHEIA